MRTSCVLVLLILAGACEPQREYPETAPDAWQGLDLAVQNDPGLPDATWADVGTWDLALPDDGAGEIPVDATVTPSTRLDCKPCQSDLDCGGDARCIPVGATKHCLHDCTDDGDCPPSYLCYAASIATKSCLPVSYNCVACAWEEPCAAGTTCDFVSGQCDWPTPMCGNCTYDFDCEAGWRCLKKTGNPTGVCAPPCDDAGACPDPAHMECVTTDRGLRLCQVDVDCYCAGCPPDRPFPAGDCSTCWACVNNSNCNAARGEICDVGTHTCIGTGCDCGASGLFNCVPGGCQCVQCCGDEDCDTGEGPCVDGRCLNFVDDCHGACTDPFPVCAVINNVSQCVQCRIDPDCAAIDPACSCTGDPTYSCLGADGSVCQPAVSNPCLADADCQRIDPACTCSGDPTYQCVLAEGGLCRGPTCSALCTSDADCPPSPWGGTLACSATGGGFCLSPDGRCDNMTACCGAGQDCRVLPGLLAGADPLVMQAWCTCDDGHPCRDGLPCTAVADLCGLPGVGVLICPAGTVPAGVPDRMCVDPATLAGVL